MVAFGFKGAGPEHWENFERLLEDLKRAGFSWIEIRAPEQPDPVWEERLREEREKNGWSIAVHARFFGINLSSPNPKVRRAAVEVALEDLTFSQRIGASRLNLHAGDVNWYDVPPPDHPAHGWMIQELNRLRTRHLKAALESIAEISEAARKAGIEVLVENLYKPWDMLLSPDEVKVFLEQLDPSVNFTLDTGHALLAGWSPEAFLRALNGRIRHIHLHWNDGLFDVHDFPDLSNPLLGAFVQKIGRQLPGIPLVVEILPGSSNGAMEQFLEWPLRVCTLLGSKPSSKSNKKEANNVC